MPRRYNNTRGGVSKSMKKFSRITDYLEAHHKKVYELIEDAGMLGSLNPRRGGSITFLLPDAKYTTKIRKILDSDKAEEATDILGSLILKDLLKTTKDFAERQDDIPTLLGKKLLVKSVSASKVIIEDGELTPDTKAKFFERKGSITLGNLAVWNLKGEVKYADAPKSAYKYQGSGSRGRRGRRGRKRGGAVSGGAHDLEMKKCEILAGLIREKMKSYAQTPAGQQETCPLLGEVAKQLRHYRENKHNLYKMARAILTGHPAIDIILIYENPICFPTLDVLEAHDNGVVGANDASTVRALFDMLNTPAFDDKSALVASEDGQRQLLDQRDGDGGVRLFALEKSNRSVGSYVEKLYRTLSNDNTLGTASNVYGDYVHQVFKSHCCLLQLIHEFSYLLHNALEIDVYTQENLNSKPKLAKSLGNIMNKFITTYRCGDRCVFDNSDKKIKLHKLGPLAGVPEREVLDRFVRTWFLHLPIANVSNTAADRCAVIYGSEEANDPDGEIIDVESKIMGGLDTYDDSDFEISGGAIAELKAFKAAHGGKLPEGL